MNFSDIVDPNRDGFVSLQDHMAFMISKETENVQSSQEIENAFRAITAADRPYVTKEELYAVRHAARFSCINFSTNHKLQMIFFLYHYRILLRKWQIIVWQG
jgi:hypothetical protein